MGGQARARGEHAGLAGDSISTGLTPKESGTFETIMSPFLFTDLENPVLQALRIMCRSRLNKENAGLARDVSSTSPSLGLSGTQPTASGPSRLLSRQAENK